jgi:hypothetical protein
MPWRPRASLQEAPHEIYTPGLIDGRSRGFDILRAIPESLPNCIIYGPELQSFLARHKSVVRPETLPTKDLSVVKLANVAGYLPSVETQARAFAGDIFQLDRRHSEPSNFRRTFGDSGLFVNEFWISRGERAEGWGHSS